MADKNTAERMKTLTADHLGFDEDKITDDSSFLDDLGADSLDIVELTMMMEEEFNIEIRDDEMERCDTFRQAVDLVQDKLGA